MFYNNFPYVSTAFEMLFQINTAQSTCKRQLPQELNWTFLQYSYTKVMGKKTLLKSTCRDRHTFCFKCEVAWISYCIA